MIDFQTLELIPGYTKRLVYVQLVREATEPYPAKRLRSAADIFTAFKPLADLDREVFIALHLDQKNRMAGWEVVSVGSLSASLVHPREVFKAAILSNAAALIVLHNHPSGDPSPSTEDKLITARVRSCGDILGIPLMDHVVIGVEGYRSAAEGGWL